MKQRHKESIRVNAKAILDGINVRVGQDLLTLNNDQVAALVKTMDKMKYQLPRNAKKARVICFYELLQRQAGMK